MKQTIKIFRSPIGLLKVALLAGLFAVSSIATFSGFFDMINQSNQATILKIVASVIFTFVVQASILYFAMRWWTTRVKHHLLPLCLAIFVSVIFGWGFYFNLLGLDKTLAGQIYADQRSEMLDVASSNQANIEIWVDEMGGLVAHSTAMVEKEAKEGNTCDVIWQGYGPRAKFRNQDKTILESYARTFEQTKARFNKVHADMSVDSFRYHTVGNAEKLNAYAQQMNAITGDFDRDKQELLDWLRQRIKHNDPGYTEPFNNGIWSEDIRCPDAGIERYYRSLVGTEAFSEISSINILNPNKSGVQVIQAFYSLLKLAKGNFSSDEFLALVFAILIDVLIFMITIVSPNSTPPASFLSWSEYFSNSEHKELSKYMDVSKSKKVNFYIPLDKSYLIASMLPLTTNDLVVFRGKIPHWKALFIVPSHIRARGNGAGFGHYQTHHSCPAQWVIDFKHKERQQEAVSQEADAQQFSLYSDTSPQGDSKTVSNATSQALKPKSSLNGNGSEGVEHSNPSISSNGNHKGVEDATQ